MQPARRRCLESSVWSFCLFFFFLSFSFFSSTCVEVTSGRAGKEKIDRTVMSGPCSEASRPLSGGGSRSGQPFSAHFPEEPLRGPSSASPLLSSLERGWVDSGEPGRLTWLCHVSFARLIWHLYEPEGVVVSPNLSQMFQAKVFWQNRF